MFSTSTRKWLILPLVSLVLALILAGCSATKATGTITEAGSTTVQPVAEKLAEAFKQKNPGVAITVQGGGSSVGVKSAADSTVDIGAISRELKPDEPKLFTHLLARDGIAIVVNSNNPVNGLTRDQVIKIFAGQVTSWSDVGGGSGNITVIAREEGSGTRTAFEEMVMGEILIAATAILQSSNGAIKSAVTSTPLGIGFISLGYLDKTVKALEIDGVAPTPENCKSLKYPVVRPLYFLTRTQPGGPVKEFIDFCLSNEGQKVVEEEGYLSVK